METRNYNISHENKIQILKEAFHHDSFREGQEEIINHILSGKDTVNVIPTGGGKSLIFQFAAKVFEGITIVISPLIALMEDQIRNSKKTDLPAVYINHTMEWGEIIKVIEIIKTGDSKLVYVSPERLSQDGFIDLCKTLNISFLVVDEAHCISKWGYGFRPQYREISKFVEGLSKRPIIAAFTATATKRTRKDIATNLGMINPIYYEAPLMRNNLYIASRKRNDKGKQTYIQKVIEGFKEDKGIIYCVTKRKVDELYEHYKNLKSTSERVYKFHSGMEEDDKKKSYEAFINQKDAVIIATNAFGMGIDVPNIRFIIHYNIPIDIEGYYQEIGRAGRDGKPSQCVLLWNEDDVGISRYLNDIKMESIRKTAREYREENLSREEVYSGFYAIVDYATLEDGYDKFIKLYFALESNYEPHQDTIYADDYGYYNPYDPPKDLRWNAAHGRPKYIKKRYRR